MYGLPVRTYSTVVMKRLFAVLMAAVLIAVALFTSVSLDKPGRVIAQGSSDSSVSHSPVSSAGAALAEPDETEIVIFDSVSSAHRQYYASRWGVKRIGAPEAWDTANFAPTLVAVLDTGITTDAPFADRIVGAIDFTGSGTTDDENGHGTHMADTIAGIAPNAQILNVKVADHRGRCDSATVAQAIRWAVGRGAQVINVSLEVAHTAQLEDAVSYAWDKGAMIVVAAGNSGTTVETYPAAYANAVAVAGTNQNDGLAVLSNHGDWVDIAGPGHKVVAYSHEGELTNETGTSPAAAHVSGVAALLFGLDNSDRADELTNDVVRHALLSSAEGLPIAGTGRGLVNAPTAIATLGI